MRERACIWVEKEQKWWQTECGTVFVVAYANDYLYCPNCGCRTSLYPRQEPPQATLPPTVGSEITLSGLKAEYPGVLERFDSALVGDTIHITNTSHPPATYRCVRMDGEPIFLKEAAP